MQYPMAFRLDRVGGGHYYTRDFDNPSIGTVVSVDDPKEVIVSYAPRGGRVAIPLPINPKIFTLLPKRKYARLGRVLDQHAQRSYTSRAKSQTRRKRSYSSRSK